MVEGLVVTVPAEVNIWSNDGMYWKQEESKTNGCTISLFSFDMA